MKQENINKILENKKLNIYFNDNKKYFEELFDIVVNNPRHFGRMIFSNGSQGLHKNRCYLANWINENLSILANTKYTITTKCYWILNGLVDFPKCIICKGPITVNALNIDTYNKTCGKNECLHELAYKTKKQKNIENRIIVKSEEKRKYIKKIQQLIEQKLLLAKTHEQFIEVFMFIYKNIGRPFVRIQKDVMYKKLYNEIIKYTLLLNDPFFTFQTKCYWFVNNIIAFPICNNQNCNKEIKQNIRSFIDGYQRKITINNQRVNKKDELYCCKECAQSSNFTITKKSKTKKEHYNDPTYNNRIQAKLSMIDRFGVDNNMKSEIGKQQYIESIKKYYGNQFTSVLQVPEIKEKIKQTNNMKSLEEKQKTSNLIKAHWKSMSTEQKLKITQKSKKTYYDKTGYQHPSHNPNVNIGNNRYRYDNFNFASSWEIIFYIWLKIHNYSFIFQPKDSLFEYIDYKGKTHIYRPDFKIICDGKKFCAGIYEIKGDNHFDKKTKKMINISNPTKNYITEAKYKCMLDNNIKIIKSLEINEIAKEVFMKIGGKQELDKFKV